MARGDPYIDLSPNVADGTDVTFDGSASATGAAIISEVSGNVDAELYLEAEASSGSWLDIGQLTTDAGDTTFTGDFHTQFNRIMVKSGERRLRIKNVSTSTGNFQVTGDEK